MFLNFITFSQLVFDVFVKSKKKELKSPEPLLSSVLGPHKTVMEVLLVKENHYYSQPIYYYFFFRVDSIKSFHVMQ